MTFSALLKRDLRLAVRQGGGAGMAIGFFLIVVSMIPIGVGPDLNLLSTLKWKPSEITPPASA